jgi:electron transfer flavoprotein beta subunit
MNLLVCISKTPDTTSKISFKNNDTEFNSDGVSFILNPYDEWYALVRALELVETEGGKVTVLNMGNVSNDIVIRKALALGADEAVRIDGEPTDAYSVAANIASYVQSNPMDAIFLGKETIDFNGAEVGAMLAEMLALPYISFVTKLEKNGTNVLITREIEGGTETCEVEGPFVLSAAKGLAEQRIPNMKGIMMAKSKPLHVIPAVNGQSRVRTVRFTLPAAKTGVKLISPENMDELVRLLHEEVKVI